MTSTRGLDRLSLTSPSALVAAIPYLLGFHPARSAVVLWLEGGRILLTQRLDLPPADGGADDPWLRAVWGHAAADRAEELVLVCVDEQLRPPLVERLVECAGVAGVQVRDVLLVVEGRWRSLLCDDPSCCPDGGRPVPAAEVDRIAAEFAVLGRAPLPSREDLVRGMAADPPDAAVVAALAVVDAVPDGGLEAWRDDRIADALALLERSGPGRPAPDALASVIAGLADVRVRDTVLWEVAGRPVEDCETGVAALLVAVRAAPEGRVAPVATCCAALCWLAGDGARALTALDRAQADDPGYSLADLLRTSIGAGLPPSAWREALGALSRQECRHGR